MNANSDGTIYNREFVRKAWPLLDLYNQAGWVRPPVGNTTGTLASRRVSQINQDGTTSSEGQFEMPDNTDLNDPTSLIRLHGYDPCRFTLVSAKNSNWSIGSGKNMFSSRITVKPKVVEPGPDDFSKWFDRLDRNYSIPLARNLPLHNDGDKLLIIPISDLHYNLQATMMSSGNEYNCKTAEALLFHVLADVLAETKDYKFSKVIFTIGGDQMNADGPANTTTKGTAQDCEVPYFDACESMYAMTVKAIDLLATETRAPVDVIYVPGNHDKVNGFQLALYINAWFRDNPLVKVDYSPLPRKYTVWGSTMFVFAHDGDLKRLPQLIADEGRKHWSSVKFTEVFLQHLHSEQVLLEQFSMRIQRLPSVVAKSAWTVDQGYSSRRQCKSFVYDKEYGLRHVIYTTI